MEQAQYSGKNWYVVLTKPRSEETARFYLDSKGVEVFYPKLLLPVPNKSGRRVVSLFSNYLFVRIDALSNEYSQVLWCRGIKRFVSFSGALAPVENKVIEFIKLQSDSHGLIAACCNLKVGDEVQIAKGPFRGLIGIIQEPPDTKSRVKVLMALLSRDVQVEVPASYIDVGWVAPRVTA